MSEDKQNFPLTLCQTKVEGLDKIFNLADSAERLEYFQAKVGAEIKGLKEYFAGHTFIAYWLGKKNSGKGTYSKLMMEIFGADSISHISVGDVVRDVHAALADEQKKAELLAYLNENYRGFISAEKAIDALLGRNQKTLLPTEFILALIKREIDQRPKKILFIDGFPREMDQINYALYFRHLIDYRSDPDIFIGINIPEAVIDERMKYRVVCPICHTPRNLKLLATQTVGYDKENKEFFLRCDTPGCNHARMVAKEGDNLGIESIRERLELDDKLINKVMALHGVEKIYLRNALPVKDAALVDNYELTPEYVYKLNGERVEVTEKPWTIKDDEGVESLSLLSPAVVVSLIKQLAKIFLK